MFIFYYSCYKMLKNFTDEELKLFLEKNYNILGTIKQVGSYSDKNYIVKSHQTNPHRKYVLKISNFQQKQSMLRIISHTLNQIKDLKADCCRFPELVLSVKGEEMIRIAEDGNKVNFARVFKFVEGSDMTEVKDLPDNIFFEAGAISARIQVFLEYLSQQQKTKELLSGVEASDFSDGKWSFPQKYKNCRQYVDGDLLGMVDQAKKQFQEVVPVLTKMPKQLIHNDICPTNMLVNKSKENKYFVSGVIDFNSMAYCQPIFELVALASEINQDQKDPLKNALLCIKGYHSIRKISAAEKDILLKLIRIDLAFYLLYTWKEFSVNNQEEYMVQQKIRTRKHAEIFFSEQTRQRFALEIEKVLE